MEPLVSFLIMPRSISTIKVCIDQAVSVTDSYVCQIRCILAVSVISRGKDAEVTCSDALAPRLPVPSRAPDLRRSTCFLPLPAGFAHLSRRVHLPADQSLVRLVPPETASGG